MAKNGPLLAEFWIIFRELTRCTARITSNEDHGSRRLWQTPRTLKSRLMPRMRLKPMKEMLMTKEQDAIVFGHSLPLAVLTQKEVRKGSFDESKTASIKLWCRTSQQRLKTRQLRVTTTRQTDEIPCATEATSHLETKMCSKARDSDALNEIRAACVNRRSTRSLGCFPSECALSPITLLISK